MPDTKITALTALTAADPANDVLPIVDVSDTTMAASGTTKKISINNVLGCSGTATFSTLTVSGAATITGNLTVDTNTFFVDSANNRVGIGTATPGNLLSVRNEAASGISYLDVRGGVGGAGVVQISGNGTTLSTTSFDLGQNSGGAFIYQRDALPLSILVNGSERYAISSTGVATWSNVGGVAGTAMTLNSTGLGVGVTPSAWNSSAKAFEIGTAGNSVFSSAATFVEMTNNAYLDSVSNWVRVNTGNAAARFRTSGSGFLWAQAAAGANPITWTTTMQLDSNGNLILQPSATPATLTTNGQLTVNATSNTNLRFSYRGSDGTTRVANITLA